MQYYFNQQITGRSMEEVEEQVAQALKAEGFGILTEIDVQATFKKKLDLDFRPYRILGACNPNFAHKAIEQESHIGVFLPCNVVIQQMEDGTVDVSAVDPVASMMAVENSGLSDVAADVRERLQRVIESL